MDSQYLIDKAVLLIPLLMSLTVHEFAHARTALAFGDPTARHMGRCTLNPLAHLDLIGTLAIIFTGFGWAKPVPVNQANLHPPRLGDIMVSLAGPLSNFALAILCAILLRLLVTFGHAMNPSTLNMLWTVLAGTMGTNVVLAVFNMVPLYPLDGHHILREHLPSHLQYGFMQWQMRYGVPLLIVIMVAPRVTGIDFPIGWMYGQAMHWLIATFLSPA